ncbi:MAG: cytochrome c oxidase subunit II [Bacteroidales bacterium]|nr:cytochrome c oxidase subunit II [Bacteroidales bacterium]
MITYTVKPMYSGYSTFASSVDTAFVFIIGISAIFLIGITAAMIYFIIKYNKKRHPVAEEIEGSTKLEIIWTVIPTILVIIMFFLGWHAYTPMRKIPKDAINVKVTAQMWSWRFEYENGKVTDTLIVPVGKNIAMQLNAVDVIHSLYIPDFRIKEDLVPNRKNAMWFNAPILGTYELFCTEYCGLRHSYMITAVKVIPVEEYNKWYASAPAKLDSAAAAVPGALGKLIVQSKACVACHTADGTKLVGPSFKGIYGHKVTVETNGKEREITVDDEYIKRSILEPEADVVKGFVKGQMVSYKGQLTDEEIKQITEYIKSLGEKE